MSYPWRTGNQIRLLENGEAFYDRVFTEIARAQREIIIETFILFEDAVGKELQRLLLAAAARGVQITVTVDGYGSPEFSADFLKAMTDAGICLQMYDPRPRLFGMRTNLFRRLHRKIVLVDSSVAFVGGMNFSEEQLPNRHQNAKWDYSVELRGPVVNDVHDFLLQEFAPQRHRNHWAPGVVAGGSACLDHLSCCYEDAAVAFVRRDNQEHKKDIETQYLYAIENARHHILIANAYFFPGHRFLNALIEAAQRGVQVYLLLQGQPDKAWTQWISRTLYDDLLDGGVCVYEYTERPLHAKVAVVDDEWATVGSTNLDPLSLSLNLEANVMVRHPEFARYLGDRLRTLMHECSRLYRRKLGMEPGRWRSWARVLLFHLLRHFPAWFGWLPAHTPKLTVLTPELQSMKMVSRARADAREP